MSAVPPGGAQRLLGRVLRDDPAARAIIGDLHEDFVEVANRRGPSAARLWYWREALFLAAGRMVRRGEAARGLRQDALYALRALRRSPGFALFTAGVIGLGVGGAAAVYSVLKPFVLAPLPFSAAEELVWIQNDPPPGDVSLSSVTVRSANLHDFRARSRSFSGITGYNAFFDQASYTLIGVGEPIGVTGVGVAADFLDVLGIVPLHGRGFRPEEGVVGASPAVVLSHAFWVGQFGSDPTLVGRTVTIGGDPRTVVGVLPSGFDFGALFSPGVRVDFLLPFPVIADGDSGFQGNTLFLIGRLESGVGVDAAAAELDRLMAALLEENPRRWGLAAELSPLREHITGPFRPALITLVVAAAVLLLIVCVNVSNLVLARSPARARELAVRKAFGASRRRLVRQLVMETGAIAALGGLAGGALAWVLTLLVPRATELRVPLLSTVRLELDALAVGVAVALATGVAAGLVPALRVSDGSEAGVLRDGSRTVSGGRAARRMRESLVFVQVTLACVLLVGCGLLVRSFQAITAVDLGFEARSAVAWQLAPTERPRTPVEAGDYFGALVDRVASVPGVVGVGLIDGLPLGRHRLWPYTVIGEEGTDVDREQAFPHIVDAGYLSTMRIPVLEGRGIGRDDVEGSARVVVLNETGARRALGDASPIGRRIRFFGPWEWEVVGVVGDVRHVSPEDGPGVQAYFSVAQVSDFGPLDMVVRSDGTRADLTTGVAAALREVDPSMPVRETWTVQATVDRALAARRFTLGVLGAFAAAALLLAGLGVYGVLAHSVAERQAEMGIRMALGASGSAVVWSVLGRVLTLAVAGVLLGGGISLVGGRWLRSMLFGVEPTDPVTFLGMAVVLLGVATLAGALPARRAVRQGPEVLRGE